MDRRDDLIEHHSGSDRWIGALTDYIDSEFQERLSVSTEKEYRILIVLGWGLSACIHVGTERERNAFRPSEGGE